MKIEKNIYNKLLLIGFSNLSETGGIIGGNNNTVCYFHLDENNCNNSYSYTPDTNSLNRVISDWHNQNIDFYGIFHSHPDVSEHLSSADEEYIREIMVSMPDEIEHLYFPLVLPRCEKIIAYKAIRQNGIVNIIRDDVEIIEKEGKDNGK